MKAHTYHCNLKQGRDRASNWQIGNQIKQTSSINKKTEQSKQRGKNKTKKRLENQNLFLVMC